MFALFASFTCIIHFLHFSSQVPVITPWVVGPVVTEWTRNHGSTLCAPSVRALLSAFLCSVFSLFLGLLGRRAFPPERSLDFTSAHLGGGYNEREHIIIELLRVIPMAQLERLQTSIVQIKAERLDIPGCEARVSDINLLCRSIFN